MELDIEASHQISQWQGDLQSVLEGIRQKRSPCGRYKADVVVVEPEEVVPIQSSFRQGTRKLPAAYYVGRAPFFLRPLPNITPDPEISGGGEAAILSGEYRISDCTIVLGLYFERHPIGSVSFQYVVCHPEFRPAHEPRFMNEETPPEQVAILHKHKVRT